MTLKCRLEHNIDTNSKSNPTYPVIIVVEYKYCCVYEEMIQPERMQKNMYTDVYEFITLPLRPAFVTFLVCPCL